MMLSKIIFFLLLVGVVLTGCTKVAELSDEAGIVSFRITGISEGVDLDTAQLVVTKNEVLIPLEFGRKNFPLTLAVEINFSGTTDEIMSVNDQKLDLKKLVFNTVYDFKEFYMIAESGQPQLARIKLVDKLNAEITDFDPGIADKTAYSIVILNNNIRIVLKKELGWPLELTPVMQKTATATWVGYKEGDTFTFESMADNQKQVTLVAANGDEKVWNIQLVPSIENSDFELWQGVGTRSVNIDPVPGVGLGWATANNSFVQGTKPVAHGNGWAAQMTTELQSIGFLGDMITSATLFTGRFKMNISALNNPPAMTYFGIPFVSKPVSVGVEAAYTAGNQLQQSVKEKGIYTLHNLTGTDEGRIWVKVLHWAGKGDINYHEDKDPVEGLTILGEGELILDGRDVSLRSWKHYTIPIEYYAAHEYLPATHLAIVMTSSRRGDTFIGAVGSTLSADNVEINY